MKQKWKVFLSLICALVMSCSILAACDNGGETQSEVTVTLSEETLTLDLYEPATLEATVTGTDEDPVWSSSDTSVATVSDTGEVVGLKNGQATITATVGDVSDSCAVTVQSTGATPMITGLPTQVTMAVDDTRTLTPAAEYKGNALSLTYAYESSDAAVASVTSAGVITAEGRGTATVSVTASYYTFNLEQDITVTVTDNVSIALDADSLSLNVNDTRQLEATITVNGEAYTSAEGIAWSSSDSDAVEVSTAGLVTAKAETQMPVTVTLTFTYEGQPFTADCTVMVSRETVDLTDEAVTEIEIYADAEADTVTLPLSMIPSSYAVTAADVTSVRDTAYNAAIPFENDGGTLELVKFTGENTVGNIYSGETTYEIGTAEYVFEIPVLMISKVLKTADDIDDMQQYCMYDPATVYSVADGDFYYVGYFVLGDDIDYGGKTIGDWTSYDAIGGSSNGTQGFMGTFDGRNHTISNMAVNNNNNGFIGTLGQDGVMKNVAFLNAQLLRGQCGVAVGLVGGKLDNVIVHGTRLAASASWCNSGLLASKVCNPAASISNVLVFYEDFDFAGSAYDALIIGSNDSGAAVPMTNAYAVCNVETDKLWVKDTNVNSFVAYGYATVGELLAGGEYDASGFVGWDSATTEKYGIALPATFADSAATDADFLYSARITNTVLNAYPGNTTVNVVNRTDASVAFSLKEAVAGVTIDASTGVITVDSDTATNGAKFTVVATVGDGKYQTHEVQFTVANKLNLSGSLVIDLDLGVSDDVGIDAALFPESYPDFSFDDVNGVLNNDTQAAVEFEVSEGELYLKGLAAGEYSILVSTDAADFNLEVIVATMTIGSAADMQAFDRLIFTEGTSIDDPLTGYYLMVADVDMARTEYVFGDNEGAYSVNGGTAYAFGGTFNGNGYALKNALIGNRGLFWEIAASGVVKNLAIIDAYALGWKTADDAQYEAETRVNNGATVIADMHYGLIENVYIGGKMGHGHWNFDGLFGQNRGDMVNVIVDIYYDTTDGSAGASSVTSLIGFNGGTYTNVVFVTNTEYIWADGNGTPQTSVPSGITVYKTGAEAVAAIDLSATSFDSAYWTENAEGILYGDELVLSVRVRVAGETLVDLSTANGDGAVALDLTNIKAVDSAFTAESVTDAYLYNGAEPGADIAHSASEGSLLLSGLTEGSYDIVLVTATAEYRVPVWVVTMVIDSEEDLIAFDTLIKEQGTEQNSVTGYYLLTADIDMAESEYVFGDLAGAYEDDTARYFAGTFDGNGFAIKNATVGNKGLFWYITGSGVVKNLAVIDATALGFFKNGTQSQQNVTSSNLFADWNAGRIENVYIGGEVGYGSTNYSGMIGQNRGSMVNVVLNLTVNEAHEEGYTYLSALGYVHTPTATFTNVILITSYTNVAYAAAAPMAAPAGVTLYASEQLASRDDLAAFSPDYWSKNADGETLFGDEVVVAGPHKVEAVSDKVIDLSAAAENTVVLDIAAILAEDPEFDVNDIIGIAYYGGGAIEYSVSEGSLLLEDGIDSGVYQIVISTADTDYVVTVEVATMVIENEADLIALETAINATTESAPLTGYYVLAGDIDLSESTHVFGADRAKDKGYFAGTFDGKGYAVKGMVSGERGLFNNVSASGIVRNVAFIDAYGLSPNEDADVAVISSAILGGWFRGTMENVFVSGEVGRGSGGEFSGIWWRWQAATVNNSVFAVEQNDVYTGTSDHSSVLGYASGSSRFTNVILITASEYIYSNDYGAGAKQTVAPNGVTLYRVASVAAAAETFDFGSFTKAENGAVSFGDEVIIAAVSTTTVATATEVDLAKAVEGMVAFDLTNVTAADESFAAENVIGVAYAAGGSIGFSVSEDTLYLSSSLTSGSYNIIVCTAEKNYLVAVSVVTVISDLEDLQAFDAAINAATPADPLTGYYVLSADIVVPDDSGFIMGNYSSAGDGYWPIDDESDVFAGTFDGRGYTISGLKVGDSGIFGNMVGATVKNVSFVDIYAYGNSEEGVTVKYGSNILAGMVDKTTIENVFVSGSISGNGGNSWYSGVMFDVQNTTIRNSVFEVEVRGELARYSSAMGLLRTNTYSNVVLLTTATAIYDNNSAQDVADSPDATNFRVYADVAVAVAGEEFGFGSFTKDGSGNILFNGEIVVAAEAAE